MNAKRMILAVFVGYIVLLALGYVIHSIWLAPLYREHLTVWRPEETLRQKLWVVWIAQLLFAVMFVWIYAKGVENKPWVAQGLRYGIFMTLLAVIPMVLNEYVVYPIPSALALKWIGAGALQLLLFGLITAGFCRKTTS